MSLFGRLRGWLGRESDAVGLCRTLDPAGWEHLHEADAAGQGVLLFIQGEASLAREVAQLWLNSELDLDEASDGSVHEVLARGARVVLIESVVSDAQARAARVAVETGCAIVPVQIERVGKDTRLRIAPRLAR